MAGGGVRYIDLLPRDDTPRDEILRGLAQRPKQLPSKLFYDSGGCALFERICDLPEYYLTRAELQLMERHVSDIAAFLGPACRLIEFGSGSGRKTRILIQSLEPALYVAIDIAESALHSVGVELAAAFPALPIVTVRADFTRPIELPMLDEYRGGRLAVYFPGSTVGNFTRQQASTFLSQVHHLLGAGGALVIGVDLKKSAERLHAAYNDAAGVTAAFNLNLLTHLDRDYGADFDTSAFQHVAFYDDALGRVEMHLRSLREQVVTISGQAFRFAPGELMRTEISCKYSIEEFAALARSAGFEAARCWLDDDGLFAVHGLVAK